MDSDSYDPYFTPRFDTNDGHTSPPLFADDAASGSDDPVFNAATDPAFKDPLNSQKSTTKSVPMDISLSGKTISGSQRSEADKKTSEAEGRNSRQMNSPLRASPAKSPLRAAQAAATTIVASPPRKLNESFRGVLPKNNQDASPTRNQNGNAESAALNASIRHVHAGELARVPPNLLNNGQVFLTCVPMVYNSGDNSWTSQGSIIVPPNTATDFCGFSIRPSDATANVTTVDSETLESARKPRSTLRQNSTGRKNSTSTAQRDNQSSTARAARQSSVKGGGSGMKSSGRKVAFSPVPMDDEMDQDEKNTTADLEDNAMDADEGDPDYDQSIGNRRGKNSSGKKSTEKKSSNAKFKTPARISSAKSSGKKVKTPNFDDDVVESSPVKAEEILPAASGSSNKKKSADVFDFDDEDAPGPRKLTTYQRTPQLKNSKKTPTSSSSVRDKDKPSGTRKKSAVEEDKSDTEDIDGPAEAKKSMDKKAKDAEEKSSNTKKDGGKVSSESMKKKVTSLDESDDEVDAGKGEEKADKPRPSLPAKYQNNKLGSIKQSIEEKYEEEGEKEEKEEIKGDKVDKGKRPSKAAPKPIVAKKKSVVEDMDEDDEGSEVFEPKKPNPVLARKTGRARAPSDVAKDAKAQEEKEKAEKAEKEKDKAGRASIKGRKRTQPEDEETASERATLESEGPSSKGAKKKRGSTVANLQPDSVPSSRESSQVGRKKEKEVPAEDVKKGRKKSGSVGSKKTSQSDFVVSLSKSVTGEVRERFDQVADEQKWEVHGDLVDNATHLAVSLEDDKKRLTKRTVTFLKAVLRGIWIVDPEWLVSCARREEKADEEVYEIPGAVNQGAKNGPKRARKSRENSDPKLFVGCNFYFANVKKLKDDFKLMIEMGGGKMMTQEPTKRNRPSKERLFHASKDSIVGACHYFIVDDDVKEATLKSGVPSCAVIPGAWLSDSIEAYQLKEVKGDDEEDESNEM